MESILPLPKELSTFVNLYFRTLNLYNINLLIKYKMKGLSIMSHGLLGVKQTNSNDKMHSRTRKSSS